MFNTEQAPNIGEIITLVMVKDGSRLPIMSTGYVDECGVARMFSVIHNQFIHITEGYRVVGWMAIDIPAVEDLPQLDTQIDVIPF